LYMMQTGSIKDILVNTSKLALFWFVPHQIKITVQLKIV